MEKNIVALLEQNLRVIIPEFGAFIIRQKDPRIIIFNEFLRYDDGLLVDYIAKTSRMEPESARKELANYAEFATKELEAGNTFSIEGLGTLKKDQAGKVIFTETGNPAVPDISQKGFEPVFQLTDDETEANPKPKKVSKPSGKKIVTAKSADIPPEPKETKPETPAPQNPVEVPVPVTGAQAISETPKAEKPAGVEVKETVDIPADVVKPGIDSDKPVESVKPGVQEPAKAAPAAKQVATQAQPYPRKITNKPATVKPNRTVRWLIALLIFNSLIILIFVFHNNIRGLSKPHKTPVSMMSDSVLDKLTDSMMVAVTDTTSVTDSHEAVEKTKPVSDPVKTATKPAMKYYIVAGCFRDEVNADELVKSLRKMGYKAEKFGKIGDLYAVSFVSLDNKDEAVNELRKIRENMHPEAWMTQF
jgi:nucleoid DNA-binding protein